MKSQELENMHRSFSILDERRKKLLTHNKTKQLRERVQKIREEAIRNLPQLLKTAQNNLEKNGVEVITAHTAAEAREAIHSIVKEEKKVVKSKSNTAGEILLTEHLESQGIPVLETDLGDRIVQLHKESKPSHPIGPAAHLNLTEITQIVSNYLKKDIEPQPRPLLEAVKADILLNMEGSRVGITGANSVAAEDGCLLMVHNEGNISLLSLLDTHIILVGIDKLVRELEDAISVVKLETIYATGKHVPAYMNVISSPSKTADIEQVLLKDMYGARRVVVIFLDNGRLDALENAIESLYCIGCGSCVVNCPVYNVTGPDFGYRRHLGGRGILISRYMKDSNASKESGLYNCTLCGLCTLECPLAIPTNQLLESLREECAQDGLSPPEHQMIKDNIKKKGSPFNSPNGTDFK